ncbi:MAG: hypothetical protein IIX99_01370 [Oscillospiraceae bacterium]|nr:hypothetical protein [Oscillospiraceae bacterium]
MFIIHEMQTTGNQTALVPAKTYTDRNEAESAYHGVLAAAAISSVPVHAVVLMDEHGNTLRREFYEHTEAGNE